MKIESYEPYHIGTKLNPYMNFDALKEKLKTELGKRGYELSKEVVTEPIRIVPSREVLASKKDTKVELNLSAQALNAIGSTPKNVLETFNELMNLLPTLGYETDAAIVFHEILAGINIKTDEKPLEILRKSTRIKFKLLKDIGDLGVTALRIGSVREEDSTVNLIIEPNPASPTTRFIVSLVFRSKTRNKIELFHNQLEEKVLEVMAQLRGRRGRG
jgi:hypothetical protein